MNEHVIVARTCGPFSDVVDYSAHGILFLGMQIVRNILVKVIAIRFWAMIGIRPARLALVINISSRCVNF